MVILQVLLLIFLQKEKGFPLLCRQIRLPDNLTMSVFIHRIQSPP